MSISELTKKQILGFQQGELNESIIYERLAKMAPKGVNAETMEKLGSQEKQHYLIWKKYTDTELKPNWLKINWYLFTARVLGYTFAIKRMENGEENAQVNYEKLYAECPEAKQVMEDENKHEQALIGLIDEERLKYVGSMVLGMNDALVELTGTLAGLTLAMQNTRLIALSGLITGISATLSMASSEYLSSKSEGKPDCLKSAIYTGITYLITVILEIIPFLVFAPEHYLYALGSLIVIVVLIIAMFSYYISVVQDIKFSKRFGEMATISLSVAALSFIIGLLVKKFLGIDI